MIKFWAQSNDNNFLHGCVIESRNISRPSKLNVEAEPTLEQAKARIEAALKLKKAASAFNAAKEKLGEDAFNDPSSLAKAAANSGLNVENLDEWVTKAGAKEAGLPEALSQFKRQ